jgi:hypothetical protein
LIDIVRYTGGNLLFPWTVRKSHELFSARKPS